MDNLTKIVLKKFIENDISYSCLSMTSALNLSNINEVDKSLNILLETGCIKVEYQDLSFTTYSLTNKGRTYFKTHKSERFQKYWFPIITSVISYILGLITDLILLYLKK